MLIDLRKLNLRKLAVPEVDFRKLDIRKTVISGVLAVLGISIVVLSLAGTTWLLDLVDSENQLSYLKILLCACGIFTMGLALIVFSIHLMKKIVWGALGALLLVSFGLGCFALGTFFKFFLITIVAFMAVLWEIGKFSSDYE